MLELRLGLRGRMPVFADGKPVCLVCGRRPVASRPAKFKDAGYADRRSEGLNTLLQHVHPALAWANHARFVAFTMDVPLCARHLFRGRWLDLGMIVLSLAAMGVMVWLGATGVLPRKSGEIGQVLKGSLLGLTILGGWFTWSFRSKQPLLPCEVRRESEDRVVLTYPGTGPGPGSPSPPARP